jgi:hypothetical protein
LVLGPWIVATAFEAAHWSNGVSGEFGKSLPGRKVARFYDE